ncbi:ABC transporter ATP-binding protein [Granulosicoccus sp. 3-233]|uniref:ABC transporter ATP-binding protein n=1 Tax=Granulosicoccus sp. 3-233 TaxID=3417969 RepID=UPI003D3494E3
MALHTTDSAQTGNTLPDDISSPLLEAQSLSLRHAGGTGVDDISLSLRRGDIIGLLGLNGAGKSTTLRLLCGVLVPDSGSVHVNGLSLTEAPLQARAQIGYLPDQPPLYDDMRVREYLTLTGRIRGLDRRRTTLRLSQIIEQCALGDVQHRIIGTLSKGFRQRIGLAQALIHEPAVVLLDEPANGLDPQQMDGMRQLIADVGRDQTLIFSTHLLAEVTATCNRVAIIHSGRLVADRPCSGDDLAAVFQEATS